MALLAGVGPLVRRNAALVGEPPGAHRAGVRLLARVRPLVRGNVALLGEPLKKINASGSMQIYPAVSPEGPFGGNCRPWELPCSACTITTTTATTNTLESVLGFRGLYGRLG